MPQPDRPPTHVLVVDDERIIADTLALILIQKGYVARAVYSGETAAALIPELKPDVLITDVVMNGMTGIEVAIRVCKELPNCKIILISGQSVTSDLVRSAEADGHHFEMLQKPFHPEELLNHLRAYA